MTQRERMRRLMESGCSIQQITTKTGLGYRYVAATIWGLKNPQRRLAAAKRWKKRNPKWVARQRRDIRRKHREATLPHARNAHNRWVARDIQYLRNHGKSKNIRNLAKILGRTHKAVQNAGTRYRIDFRGDKIGAGAIRFKQKYARKKRK